MRYEGGSPADPTSLDRWGPGGMGGGRRGGLGTGMVRAMTTVGLVVGGRDHGGCGRRRIFKYCQCWNCSESLGG